MRYLGLFLVVIMLWGCGSAEGSWVKGELVTAEKLNAEFDAKISVGGSVNGSSLQITDNAGYSYYTDNIRNFHVSVSNDIATGAGISGKHTRGTLSLPSATQADDQLLVVYGSGYGASLPANNKANVTFGAAENWTNSAQGSYITFSTTESGGTTLTERARVHDTGNVSINDVADDGLNKLQVKGSVNAVQYRLSALNTAPASAAATGVLGEIRVAADYIYVCIAVDTWVRAPLATWP